MSITNIYNVDDFYISREELNNKKRTKEEIIRDLWLSRGFHICSYVYDSSGFGTCIYCGRNNSLELMLKNRR